MKSVRQCFFLFALMVPGQIVAQPALEATTTPFTERLVDHVPVSGRTLVGLLSEPDVQPPEGVGLLPGSMALPGDLTAAGLPICVRVTTQDGRYSAEDNFVLQRAVAENSRADLDWPTKYPESTRRFPLEEVAAVARKGSCAADADLVPIILGEGNVLGVLQLLVNTHGAAVTASLRDLDTKRTLRRSNCTRVAGTARVAFDARCVLGRTNDLPMRVQLRIEQVSHDGLQIEVLESVVLQLGDHRGG